MIVLLKGFYRVGTLRVELTGYDRLSYYEIYLTCPPKMQKFIDKGITYITADDEEITIPSRTLWGKNVEDQRYGYGKGTPLYLQIYEDKAKVSKYGYNENGTKKSYNELVKGFFTTLSAILTGCRTQCKKEYTVGYSQAFGLSQEPDATQAYTIPNISPPSKKTKLNYSAYVERKFGKIHSIHMGSESTPYELILEDDGEYTERMIKATDTLHIIPFDISTVFKDIPSKQTAKKSKTTEANLELLDSLLTWDEIQQRHPERNYGWLRGRDYKIVTDIKEVESVCKEIMEHDGIVSFDTETTGLTFTYEGMNGYGDKLVGMVFSIREGQSWYFPVRHKTIPNICTEANEFEVITKYFKPILEQKKILCHNAMFDEKVMFRYGIVTNLCEDTMVILRLSLSLEDKERPYSLKGATRAYLGRDSYELEDLVSSGKWTYDFSELPYEYVRLYACADTDNTLALYHWLKANKIFEKYDLYNIYYNVELPFTSVAAYSEYFGMLVDMDRAEELDAEMQAICEKEEAEIYKCAGHSFNINSPKELQTVLFDEMGCPILGKTKSGGVSTDKKTLKKLAGMTDEYGAPRYPIVKHLKEYKDASKLMSSFTNLLNGKSKNQDNNISPSGVISSSVQPFLETSRVSVNKPNYQSFSDTVKRYIIPRAGYYMIDADYSSVEYRITASMSGQQELIDAFFDPDTDYHKLKASLMFQIPYEDVSSEMRRMAKSFNFGIPYGMGLHSLAELLYGNKNPDSVAKAGKLYDLYFQGQEKVKKFFEDGRAQGWLLGRSRTYFGGYRYYDRTKKTREKIERESGNHLIQGTAANIYKMAMADLYRKIKENGWWGKVLISGFIHDECLLEASCEINPAIVMKALRDSMMLSIEGWCPLYTGMGCGANWDDAKHIEIPTQVQEDLLGKYGETGFPWWKGDPLELYDNMKQYIYDYKRDRVLDYLRKPENHGTVLPLIENDLAHEVISAVHDGKYTNGVVDKDQSISHDILENLHNFCIMFGEEELFKEAGLKPKVKVEQEVEVGMDFKEITPEYFEQMDADYRQQYLFEALKAYGVSLDVDNNRVYLYADDKVLLAVARKSLKTEGAYEVWMMKESWDKPKRSKYFMNGEDYLSIQQAYLSYKKD